MSDKNIIKTIDEMQDKSDKRWLRHHPFHFSSGRRNRHHHGKVIPCVDF